MPLLQVSEANYWNNYFFSLISPIFVKRKATINLNVHYHFYSSTFFINIRSNVSEQEKKRQRIYDFLYAEINQRFFVSHIWNKEKIKTAFFLKKKKWTTIEHKMKRFF